MAEVGLAFATGRHFGRRRPAAFAPSASPVELVPVTEADALAGQWSALAASALEANPLFAPGFVLAAARHFGQGALIANVRSADGRLVGLAPVTKMRLGRIAPALRIWSHDYGPLGVPLLAADVPAEAASALIAAASGKALIVPDITVDGPAAAALTAAAEAAGRSVTMIGVHERAVFRTEGDGDPRASLSAKRRKEYARQLRRLGEEAKVAQETIVEPAAVIAGFEEFLALEAAGWKGKRGTAMAAQADKQAFARAAVAKLAAAGAVQIEALRSDGRMIAGLVSLIGGDRAVTWKIAYDESMARFSPGAQVMLDAPVALAKAGVRVIDSLATADHPLVNHIWKDRQRIGTLVIAPAGGAVRHRLALALISAESRARSLAKRLRDRLRG